MQTKNFKIISTLGPSSLTQNFLDTIKKHHQLHLRFNFSHLGIQKLSDYLNFVENSFLNQKLTYYLDLPGKKMRIGHLKKPYPLTNNQEVRLIQGDKPGLTHIPIPSKALFNLITTDDLILLQDGIIKLQVLSRSQEQLKARVIQGGILRSLAGIIVHQKPELSNENPNLINSILKFAQNRHIDYLALSYITSSSDIEDLRQSCTQLSYYPKIAAKIEHPLALNNLNNICNQADEIWYCRGDLGVFISPRELAKWQDKTIKIATKNQKPVLVAGQVFQYLTEHIYPTRTEVVHFMKILDDGANGIVLSDETAIGRHSEKAAEAVFSLLKEIT